MINSPVAEKKAWHILSGPIRHTKRIIGHARDTIAPYHNIAKRLHSGTGDILKHGGSIATALGKEGTALHSYGRQASALATHFGK